MRQRWTHSPTVLFHIFSSIQILIIVLLMSPKKYLKYPTKTIISVCVPSDIPWDFARKVAGRPGDLHTNPEALWLQSGSWPGSVSATQTKRKKRLSLETMGNNEHYFFFFLFFLHQVQIGKTLKPNSFAALCIPTKLPWFNVLCFCTTLWGPWLLPIYAHSELWCIVGRRSHPNQQWCQCFFLISLGNTHPSPAWPTQQPNSPPTPIHCLFFQM